MRIIKAQVGDFEATVNVIADWADDGGTFLEWLDRQEAVGLDTEATGLDIYGEDKLRLVQFGNANEAFVMEPGCLAESGVQLARKLFVHNASFDLPIMRAGKSVWEKTVDTRILAHLVDSRGKHEGGTGHSLEDLTAAFVSESVAESIKGLMKQKAREYSTTIKDIFKTISLADEDYLLYAGVDAILAFRLGRVLLPLVPGRSRHLIKFENTVQRITTEVEQRGFKLDVQYTQTLSDSFLAEKSLWEAFAFVEYGVDNINSGPQVAEALREMGVDLDAFPRTPTGRTKLDHQVLGELEAAGNELASVIQAAKKFGKWQATWLKSFLERRDSSDVCHPHFNTLRARTARMSVTGIPAQTLPAGDPTIRRCFITDEGFDICSIDYQSQELRVLAALSGDARMRKAFADGEDLHAITAVAAFGDAEGKHRKFAKTVNFGRVYGGGAGAVASQTGLDMQTAKNVIAAFDRSYPGVKAYSRRMQNLAARDGFITTKTGRRLYVDRDKSYTAMNYMIQSTSRDITADALVRLDAAGFTPYIKLIIHDEILFQFPQHKSAAMALEAGEIMSTTLNGVKLPVDYTLGKRSWGSLYGADY